MGFLDKVKATVQEGAKTGQDKLSGMQAKRHADALLQELGEIVYCQRAGRPGTPGDDRVAAIMSQLQAYEAEHGQITPPPAAWPSTNARKPALAAPNNARPADISVSAASPISSHPTIPNAWR